MHLTNVLEGCICQYIRFVYWRDVSLNTVNLLFYGILSAFWISVSVFLCSPHGENPSVFHPHSLIPKKTPFQLYPNTTLIN